MANIQKLSTKLINQIAAGEVIERPASIVKELIENSIDANASKIIIDVEDGGQKSIRIEDNGDGMDAADLVLAFKRHATSKINIQEDLEHISSLGFRGEALPSIASVSQVIVKSTSENNTGTELIIHGGVQKSLKPIAQNIGTFIHVKNLFYNIPARRKFLKKPETEFKIITETIRKFMIAYPEISFKFTNNSKQVFNTVEDSLESRLKSIFGNSFSKMLLPVFYEKKPYKVTGYVGNLSTVRKRPGSQYLVINGRHVKDRLLNSAVFSSYRSLLGRGEYPFFALFIDMPTELLDVNVHPAKLEVRFQNEWQVYHVIKSATITALKEILDVIPNFNQYTNFNDNQTVTTSNLPFKNEVRNLPIEQAPRSFPNNDIKSELHTDFNLQRAHDRVETLVQTQHSEAVNISSNAIWQVHNTYLITEIKSGLIIIDQHVAHERILFESAKKAFNGQKLPSQTLLFPQTITFQPDEYSSLLDVIPYLHKIGFKLREFGANSIIIEGTPSDIHWGSEKEVIIEILDKFKVSRELNASFLDHIASTYACKGAVKAGDSLTTEEQRNLVDRLFATEHPYYCPHGRPIIINLSLEELGKRFERH
jgi:DNA mismatch repair protein MutL